MLKNYTDADILRMMNSPHKGSTAFDGVNITTAQKVAKKYLSLSPDNKENTTPESEPGKTKGARLMGQKKKTLCQKIKEFISGKGGEITFEYLLLITLVAVVAAVGLAYLGGAIKNNYAGRGNQVASLNQGGDKANIPIDVDDTTVPATNPPDDGDSGNPFGHRIKYIRNVCDWNIVANDSYYQDKELWIMNDIDASGAQNDNAPHTNQEENPCQGTAGSVMKQWSWGGKQYTGTLHGQGYTVKNFTVGGGSADGVSLIASIASGGSVSDLTLSDFTIDTGSTGIPVSALATNVYGKLSNINVKNATLSSKGSVGGVALYTASSASIRGGFGLSDSHLTGGPTVYGLLPSLNGDGGNILLSNNTLTSTSGSVYGATDTLSGSFGTINSSGMNLSSLGSQSSGARALGIASTLSGGSTIGALTLSAQSITSNTDAIGGIRTVKAGAIISNASLDNSGGQQITSNSTSDAYGAMTLFRVISGTVRRFSVVGKSNLDMLTHAESGGYATGFCLDNKGLVSNGTISNAYIHSLGSYVRGFGEIEDNASVSNIVGKNLRIQSNVVSSSTYTSGLFSSLGTNAKATNCSLLNSFITASGNQARGICGNTYAGSVLTSPQISNTVIRMIGVADETGIAASIGGTIYGTVTGAKSTDNTISVTGDGHKAYGLATSIQAGGKVSSSSISGGTITTTGTDGSAAGAFGTIYGVADDVDVSSEVIKGLGDRPAPASGFCPSVGDGGVVTKSSTSNLVVISNDSSSHGFSGNIYGTISLCKGLNNTVTANARYCDDQNAAPDGHGFVEQVSTTGKVTKSHVGGTTVTANYNSAMGITGRVYGSAISNSIIDSDITNLHIGGARGFGASVFTGGLVNATYGYGLSSTTNDGNACGGMSSVQGGTFKNSFVSNTLTAGDIRFGMTNFIYGACGDNFFRDNGALADTGCHPMSKTDMISGGMKSALGTTYYVYPANSYPKLTWE